MNNNNLTGTNSLASLKLYKQPDPTVIPRGRYLREIESKLYGCTPLGKRGLHYTYALPYLCSKNFTRIRFHSCVSMQMTDQIRFPWKCRLENFTTVWFPACFGRCCSRFNFCKNTDPQNTQEKGFFQMCFHLTSQPRLAKATWIWSLLFIHA